MPPARVPSRTRSILKENNLNMCSEMKEPSEGVVEDGHVKPSEFHVARDEILKNVLVLVARYILWSVLAYIGDEDLVDDGTHSIAVHEGLSGTTCRKEFAPEPDSVATCHKQ